MSIRIKMTLWYGAVLATVLVVFGTAVYLMMRHQLRTRLDSELRRALAELAEEVEEASSDARLRERLEQSFKQRDGYEFQVSSADGVIVFRTEGLKQAPLPVCSVPRSLKHLDYESVPLAARSLTFANLGHVRIVGEFIPGPSSTVVIQAATSLAQDDHELAELLLVLFLSGPVALVGALGGGYLLARKALAPVDHMARTASEITSNRLHRRIDVSNPGDELGRLAKTLNEMIARLERSFDEMQRFTADAAHELRTPLAVLRSEAEVALRSPRKPEQYCQVLETMLEEVVRLARLADQLLFLSRKDAGLIPRVREPRDLQRLTQDVAELMQPIAEANGVTLRVEKLAACPVCADEDQLRRVVFNLVDNAIKFTPAGGTVSVRCEPVAEHFGVIIRDTGIGIGAEHLPHIFERFYRVDPARSREAGGTGLGLAIGRAIAEAHGGCIRVASTPGVGTEVALLLPPLSPTGPADHKVAHEGISQGRRAPTPSGYQADAGAKERFDQCAR